MDSERWQQVQELFDQALPLPEDQRQVFLDGVCQGDDDLLQDVQSLLAADADGDGFFEDALREGLDLFQGSSKPPTTPVRFGKYEVVEEVGEGGFGKVYRGRDPQLERAVAIKICTARDPGLRQRFFREAKISAGLQHPKIVTVHDFGDEAGLPFLVQELLGGEDLDRLIARGDELSLAAKVEILLQIAQGLAYAHQQGVLHRDVKPGNIRVLADGRIKIMDFGIACLLNEEQRLTQEHTTVGTIGYIAPEQLTGHPLDERSDVFSFGVLAYELLSGQRPFQGRAFADVSHLILHHQPPSLQKVTPEISPRLADCIQSCLAKDPAARPSGFADIADRLEAVAANGLSHRSTTPRGRRFGLAAGLAAVTLMTVWSIWPTRQPVESELSPTASETELPEPIVVSEVLPEEAARPRSLAPAGPVPRPVIESKLPAAGIAAAGDVNSEDGLAKAEVVEAGQVAAKLGKTAATEDEPTEDGRTEDEPVATEPFVAGPVVAGPVVADPAEEQTRRAAELESEASVPTPPADTPSPSSVGDTSLTRTEGNSAEPGLKPEFAAAFIQAETKPLLLEHPEPQYPALARHRRLEAQVALAVLVDDQGKVRRALVTHSSDPGLGFDEAARRAALAAVFEPGYRHGEPVQEWTELTIRFRLP